MDTGTIIISVLTVAVFAGIIFFAGQGANQQLADIEIDGLQTFERTDRSHTTRSVTYEQTPPVGGPHQSTWLDCTGTVYDQPVENERAVHALEHGAVWVSYRPDVGSSTVSALSDHLANYSFLSPVPNQDSPIKLSAWGYQLAVQSADDPRVDEFLQAFSQGPQTPEPGATCSAPGGHTM